MKGDIRKKQGGFSLVEVTLAIGIASFVLMTLIGIMPVGLSATLESARQTAYSQIVSQISSDLGMLPFGEVGSYAAETQYFDQQGNKLNGAETAIFAVTMQVAPPTYPNSEKLRNLNDRMERVIVSITQYNQGEAKPVRIPLTVANSGV